MHTVIKLSFILGCLLTSGFSQALDLFNARANKDVCEGSDGYIHATKNPPSPEVQALLDDTNQKRRAEYQNIANKTNGVLKDTEEAAAVKLIKDNTGCNM